MIPDLILALADKAAVKSAMHERELFEYNFLNTLS
jgi:hypothetical protein